MRGVPAWCRPFAVAVITATVLTGCGAASAPTAFEPIPETCAELGEKVGGSVFTDYTILEPETTVPPSGRTRLLSCGIAGETHRIGLAS
jgi:hypothetical protein